VLGFTSARGSECRSLHLIAQDPETPSAQRVRQRAGTHGVHVDPVAVRMEISRQAGKQFDPIIC